MNRIKVNPQPTGLDSLWPDSRSHVEWWEVVENPDYYGSGYLPSAPEGSLISVEELSGTWFWVIEEMADRIFVSDLVDNCERCKEYGPVFYDDDGNLLCSDCLFEDEIAS